MAPTVIEGTWEEILERSAELAGRRVRVQVLSDVGPNGEDWSGLSYSERLRRSTEIAEALVAQIEPGYRGDSVKIIREGRSGPMYGYEPRED